MTFIKLALLMLVLFSLPACVGLMYSKHEEATYVKYSIAKNGDGDRVVKESTSTSMPTKAEFLEKWGEPRSINKNGESEQWVYRERRWCGVMPAVVVLLPLLLPVCKENIVVDFNEKVGTQIKVSGPRFSGVMCALVIPWSDTKTHFCE